MIGFGFGDELAMLSDRRAYMRLEGPAVRLSTSVINRVRVAVSAPLLVNWSFPEFPVSEHGVESPPDGFSRHEFIESTRGARAPIV